MDTLSTKPATILSDPHNFMVEPLKAFGDAWGPTFDAFFNRHYVLKTPTSLMLACEDPCDKDAWLVWWAEYHPPRTRKDMLREFLRVMPYYKPRTRWARPWKDRPDLADYSTDRLFEIAGMPLPDKQVLTPPEEDVKT